MSIVKSVEAELKMEVRSLMSAAKITANITPFTPDGIRRRTCKNMVPSTGVKWDRLGRNERPELKIKVEVAHERRQDHSHHHAFHSRWHQAKDLKVGGWLLV